MERRDKSYTKENAEDFEREPTDVPSKSLSNYYGRSGDNLLHRKREGVGLENRPARGSDPHVIGPGWGAGVLLVVATTSSSTSRNHHQKRQGDQQQGKIVATPARRSKDENTRQRESAAA